MTEELSYETIPNEFWPKCFWCGKDIGDNSLEVKTWYATRKICSECHDIVTAIIGDMAPIMLGDLLTKAGEREYTGRHLSIDEVRDSAIQRMKEAQKA